MSIDRRQFLTCAGFALPALLHGSRLGATPTRKPNFIFILCDDMGYADVGCFGAKGFQTPNLDRMKGEGMKFTDFYVGAPICSPSRAALMTGCYPERVGMPGVLSPTQPGQKYAVGLNPNEITVAEMLKPQGYATACVGKWHLGDVPALLSTSQGFDEFFGLPYSNDMLGPCPNTGGNDGVGKVSKPNPPLPLMEGLETIETCPDQTQLTKHYTERAISFIKKNQTNPFFLYLAHTMPHVPLHVSNRFKGTSQLGLYGDVIQELDWSVGEVFRTLRDLKIDDNTLVIFTSDNGPWLAKNEYGGHADPLRDGKFTRYEGGFRVPCLMRWPGRIPADRVCSEVSSTIDVLPTFARLAGGHVPTDRIIDGRDIWPLMSGKRGAKSPHPYFFYEIQAVRNGKWKLYLPGTYNEGARGAEGKYHYGNTTYNHLRLYDLSTDISETNEVAGQHPEIVQRLEKLVEEHIADLAASSRPAARIPLAVGGAESIHEPFWQRGIPKSFSVPDSAARGVGDEPFDLSFNRTTQFPAIIASKHDPPMFRKTFRDHATSP